MTNRSLQQKSAARLAAVQLLYKHSMSGGNFAPDKLVADYAVYLAEEEKEPVAPNAALLEKLLKGWQQHDAALEPVIEKHLLGDWKKDRTSPLLLAILRVATLELAEFREVSERVIISEYAHITRGFFSERETGFVLSTLNAISAALRT